MNPTSKIIFSTHRYRYLKEKILRLSDFEEGVMEIKKFPDGEIYQRILSSVEGREAVVIGGTISDEDTLELFDLACSIEYYGAISLTLVIPFFGYSTIFKVWKPSNIFF